MQCIFCLPDIVGYADDDSKLFLSLPKSLFNVSLDILYKYLLSLKEFKHGSKINTGL